MWFELDPVGPDFVDSAPCRLELHAVVHVAPEVVFDLFASAAHDAEWFPLYREGRWTSPPPHGEGATREVHLVGLGIREQYEILDRPRRIVVVMHAATIPAVRAMAEELRFEPFGEGKTRIIWRVAYAPRAPLALVPVVGRLVFTELFGTATRNLARYARRHAVAPDVVEAAVPEAHDAAP